MKKKLKVFPDFTYFGPGNNLCIEKQFRLICIPAPYVIYHNWWGLELGISWLFWHAKLRFAFVDMDEVRRLEVQAQKEREEYNRKEN